MKKFATMIALVALFVLAAVSVSALQLTSPTIGSDTQDRMKNVSQTFTVTNNDTVTETVAFASTADGKYAVRFVPASVDLTPGQSTSVQVIADIPLDFNAVEPSSSSTDFLKAKPFTIGAIQGKISGVVQASADLLMEAANQLNIKKAHVDCGDKTQSLSDGDRVKNLEPDTKCTMEIEVENRFSKNDQEDANGNGLKVGDIEFNTIDIQAKTQSSRDLDVNEDDSIDGLSADDKDSVTLSFDIAEDVSEGTYTVDIFVKGRDDNGAFHGEHWDVKLEVKRLTHDIQIRTASISPQRISACDGGQVHINTRLLNMGKRDEDSAAVELDAPDVKFSKKIEDITLDQDDSTSANFAFEVPAKTKPGLYRATLNTFFDNTAPSNSQALEFTVDKCDEEQQNVSMVMQPQTGQTGSNAQTANQQTAPTSSSGAVAVPRARVSSTGGFTDSSGYLWLLGGLGIVMLVIIVALLMVAFRKPRQDIM